MEVTSSLYQNLECLEVVIVRRHPEEADVLVSVLVMAVDDEAILGFLYEYFSHNVNFIL